MLTPEEQKAYEETRERLGIEASQDELSDVLLMLLESLQDADDDRLKRVFTAYYKQV
jgi:nitrate reductase assembly molybdenum cofactor insertion protein NarJ